MPRNHQLFLRASQGRSTAGAGTMAELWRGRIVSVTPVGDDLRVELEP